MEVENSEELAKNNENEETKKSSFKKPVLVGKIGRFPRKITSFKNSTENETLECSKSEVDDVENNLTQSESLIDSQGSLKLKEPSQQATENSMILPYKEPSWSGLPHSVKKDYVFEVLKSGVIVEQINLMSKSFWVFGRSVNSDIYMAHPTISRYHAVLQYRSQGTEEEPSGFYIYDLNSTHGTFLNKGRLKSRVYAPVKVGHMLKLGFSTRSYVLTGPDEDKEQESELSLTELKQKRTEKLLKRELEFKEAMLKEEREKELRQKKLEERGVDWGLSEDADEETDLTENPFAETNNEELYIDDPKKALRGFMEREGYSLDYDCTEQGFGQFLCKVELPLDDDQGRRIVAEVLHKGKKKEAVIQCALEACKILDRHGVLRQATHESRKRKARNWEENDYYDSDDDTFLDRTGTVEKKREKRMNSKIAQQPETYQSLLEKEKNISTQINVIEKQLSIAKKQTSQSETAEEDPLESFMKELKDSRPDKQTISKLKSDLAALKIEHVNIVKLVNLAKPVDLPPLVVPNTSEQTQLNALSKDKLPIFGKRKKVKVDIPQKSETVLNRTSGDEEEASEVDSVCNSVEPNELEPETLSSNRAETLPNKKTLEKETDNVPCHIKIYRKIIEMERIMTTKKFPSALNNCIEQISDVLVEVKNVIEQKGKLQTDKNLIMAKNRKVKKHIDNLLGSYDENHLIRICKELKRIDLEIQSMTDKQYEVFSKIRVLAVKIDLVSKHVMEQVKQYKDSNIDESNKILNHSSLDENVQLSEEDDEDSETLLTPEELEKRKKKNQRRNQHRKEKNAIEKQRGYQEDARKEDYNMWIPPQNQTGDGRTTLNEKYGY